MGWAQQALADLQKNDGDEGVLEDKKKQDGGNEVPIEQRPESKDEQVNVETKDGNTVPVWIYTNSAIDQMTKDSLQSIANDFYDTLRNSVTDPVTEEPPTDLNKLRVWVKKIQTKHLEPLKETPIQQELRKLRNRINSEFEKVEARTSKPEVLLDELEALMKMVKQNPDQDDSDEQQDAVSYADLQKVKIWPLIRKIFFSKGSTDMKLKSKIDEVRERFRSLEKLNTTFKFDSNRVLKDYAWDNQAFFDQYRKAPNRVRCRIYFVKAIVIFEKAYGSADPYIKYRIGDDVTSLRSSAVKETNEPEFYKVEERDIVFPQGCRLQVDLFDVGDVPLDGVVTKQGAFDSIIGSTILDLEDRWHSNEMRMDTVRGRIPHENRRLYKINDNKESVTGSLVLWIEMIDAREAADKKATQLQKPKPQEIELRLVIRTCHNVKLIDNGKVDVKVGVGLQCDKYFGPYPIHQTTDVHFGSTDGHAVFNWRIVFPKITMPTKSCILDLILYDYNLLAGDTPIGSISLDIRKYLEKVAVSMDTIQKDDNKLQFTSKADEDVGVNVGEILFDMTVMPQTEALSKPAGIERQDPNENPQLLTPKEGRDWDSVLPSLAFSIPSFGFYKKVLPLIFLTLLCLVGLKYVGLL
jgi:hypothetical protein